MEDPRNGKAIADDVYQPYLNHLLAGRKPECARIVTDLIDGGNRVKDLYIGLFQRSMYQVGELWESNAISVAVEHLATSITENLFALTYPTIFGADHSNKSAVVPCGVNEFHQIGGRMAAGIFELNGWHGHFLGANTPTSDLMEMVKDERPDAIALSLSIYYNLEPLLRTLEAVPHAFPTLPIVVGGQAFRWGDEESLSQFPLVRVLRTIERLEEWIREN